MTKRHTPNIALLLLLSSLVLLGGCHQSPRPDRLDVTERNVKDAFTLLREERLFEADRAMRAGMRQAERDGLPEATAVYMQGIGGVAFQDGRYGDTIDWFRRAIAAERQLPEPDANFITNVLADLCVAYCADGRLPDATRTAKEMDSLDRGRLKPTDPELLTHIRSKAQLAAFRKEHSKSIDLWRRAIAVSRANGRDKPSDLAIFWLGLGWQMYELKRYPEAEALMRRAVNGLDESGSRHSRVGVAYQNLAAVCAKQRRYAESMRYYRKAIDIISARLGPDNRLLHRTYTWYADSLVKTGHRQEAAAMRAKARVVAMKYKLKPEYR